MSLCTRCRSLTPVLHNFSASPFVKDEEYAAHHDTFWNVNKARASGCYVCTRLWVSILRKVDIKYYDEVQPATFCLGETWAKQKKDTMAKAMVSFYRKGLHDSEERFVLVGTFRCVPMAGGE